MRIIQKSQVNFQNGQKLLWAFLFLLVFTKYIIPSSFYVFLYVTCISNESDLCGLFIQHRFDDMSETVFETNLPVFDFGAKTHISSYTVRTKGVILISGVGSLTNFRSCRGNHVRSQPPQSFGQVPATPAPRAGHHLMGCNRCRGSANPTHWFATADAKLTKKNEKTTYLEFKWTLSRSTERQKKQYTKRS